MAAKKPTKRTKRQLTLGELQQIDALVSRAQESGLKLGDAVKFQSEVCCCGAVTATAHGKFVYTARDRELVRQIAQLESQIESSPTLGQLLEARGELLRGAKGKR
jgi:hypothetical protein